MSAEKLRNEIVGLLRHHFQSTALDTMVERLFDLCEDRVEQERQASWDEGYDCGMEEGEANTYDRYDEGYEDGYRDGEQAGGEFV